MQPRDLMFHAETEPPHTTRDNRRAAGHRFNGNEAKRFVP